MKTKNIQDVVAELESLCHQCFNAGFSSGLDENRKFRGGDLFHETKAYKRMQELTTTLTQLVKEAEAGERNRIEKLNREIGYLRDTPRVRRDFCEWCGEVCLKGDVCDCHTEKVRQDLLDIVTDDIESIFTPPTSDVEKQVHGVIIGKE